MSDDLETWLEDAAARPRVRQPNTAPGYEQHPDYGGRPLQISPPHRPGGFVPAALFAPAPLDNVIFSH